MQRDDAVLARADRPDQAARRHVEVKPRTEKHHLGVRYNVPVCVLDDCTQLHAFADLEFERAGLDFDTCGLLGKNGKRECDQQQAGGTLVHIVSPCVRRPRHADGRRFQPGRVVGCVEPLILVAAAGDCDTLAGVNDTPERE